MSRISAAVIGALLLALALGTRVERRPSPNRSTRSFVSDTARRDANVSTIAALADSVRGARQQYSTLERRRQLLVRALERERHRTDSLRTALHAHQIAQVTNGAGKGDSVHPLWTAHFDIRHAPYTMRADVWFPPPPDSARLQVGVTLDTIPLLVHIVCAPTLLGFRTPMVTVESAPWAHVRLDHVDRDVSVCMPPVDPLWRRRLIEFDTTPSRSH